MDSLTIQRRQIVNSGILRGFNLQEIADALAKKNFPNDEDTIREDVIALSMEWEKAAGQVRERYAVTLLAELKEIKRAAWGLNDFNTVLKVLEQEANLLTRTVKPVTVPVTSQAQQALVEVKSKAAQELDRLRILTG